MLNIPRQHLLCVGPADLPKVWPLVADMIDKAYAELDEVTPDVLAWLSEGKGLLWTLWIDGQIIAAATSSLVTRRQGLALLMVACGGSQGDWETSLGEIEQYAWAEGCYKAEINGRRGWGRVLSDYRPTCVSYEKRNPGHG